jgi:hypothetical protein
MNIGLRLRKGLKQKQRPGLAARIRLSGCMELAEQEFTRFVLEVENDPLFRKLYAPARKEHRVIGCKKFRGTRFLIDFLPLNEAIIRDPGNLEIETLMQRHRQAVPLVQRIGRENFENFFIFDDGAATSTKSAACGITDEEVHLIDRFTDDLSLYGEFYRLSPVAGQEELPCCRIAVIERDLTVSLCSPKFAAGRYVVDYGRLKVLKKNGHFTGQELAAVDTLLASVEMINAKKTTVLRILEKVVEKQQAFLLSGDERDRAVYTQRELARDLGLSDSLVSRALYRRSLGFCGKREMPLQFFFPNGRTVRKVLVRRILEERGETLSDRELQDLLKTRHGIAVARRTINSYRGRLSLRGKN